MAQHSKPGSSGISKRGFASMDPALQREIASKGGRSVPPEERSFSKDRALAAQAGRKGGEASHGGRRSGPDSGSAASIAGSGASSASAAAGVGSTAPPPGAGVSRPGSPSEAPSGVSRTGSPGNRPLQ